VSNKIRTVFAPCTFLYNQGGHLRLPQRLVRRVLRLRLYLVPIASRIADPAYAQVKVVGLGPRPAIALILSLGMLPGVKTGCLRQVNERGKVHGEGITGLRLIDW
jgi:hypothetical protein